MKFVNPLPFVSDIRRAKRFYAEVLGVPVAKDHGDFVQFQGGFALHDGTALLRTVFGNAPHLDGRFGRDNLVLYFEDEDIDAAYARVAREADIIHSIRTEPWGQRVFRFRDPDGHIVEVGEPQ